MKENTGQSTGSSAWRVMTLRTAIASVMRFLICTVAVLSLCAAGSDGPWFPWPNVAGLFVLIIIAIGITRGKRQPIT